MFRKKESEGKVKRRKSAHISGSDMSRLLLISGSVVSGLLIDWCTSLGACGRCLEAIG